MGVIGWPDCARGAIEISLVIQHQGATGEDRVDSRSARGSASACHLYCCDAP
jgi:hypothetical protein